MMDDYDIISVTEKDEGVVLWLPDGSSVDVPAATIRRSSVLQEAIHTSDETEDMRISLPRGVLQDWLQSVDALKSETGDPNCPDIAQNPRILRFLTVRCCSSCDRGHPLACV